MCWNTQAMVKGVDVKNFFLCKSYVTKIRQTLDKNPQTCKILFRPGSVLTCPVSMMSEYKESPKDIQSSLGAHL